MRSVLLINPSWRKKRDSIWSKISSVSPPIGLASIASFLENRGVRVSVLDMNALKLSPSNLPEIQELTGYDVVGISCTTPLIAESSEIVEILRKIIPPGSTIVLGGVHPTVAPEECIMIEGVDYVARGEGELTMMDIAEEKKPEDILGISYVKNGRIVHNKPRPFIKDLDELPLPAYHMLPMQAYRPALGAFKQLPGIGIITSRGCPGRCTFCYRMFGNRLRLRSADSIIAEVNLLHRKHNIREISFYDDTFTASRKRVMNICDALSEQRIGISWSCFARVDCVDQEMLYRMKESGCHQVMYGIESASEEILKNINKRTDLKKALDAVKWTKRAGIDVRAAFMLGNPGETEETLEKTYQLAVRMAPELVIFNITTPFPGTEMFEWAKKNDYLLSEDWRDYDLAHPVMNLPGISSERIRDAYHEMYRRFYRRPGYVVKRLRTLTSWLQIKTALKAFVSIVGIR
ncbi:B12-binding domain-containing radical SAM protein [Candidatus Hydrogenedentota bacterium]